MNDADVIIPDVAHVREANAFIRGVARHQSNMAGEADCSQL